MAVRALVALLLIPFSAQPQSLLRIQILEGEGAINSAGSRSERPIAVQLTDETGRPLEGVAVSFRLPEEGPGGTFESRGRTEIVVTGPDGRAAVRGIRWNRIPGPFQIRITAAKSDSRAGAICSQYISDTPVAKTSGPKGGRKGKWILLAAVAGGAAAGIAVGMGGQAQSSPQGPSATAPTVQIGPPTISLGKP